MGGSFVEVDPINGAFGPPVLRKGARHIGATERCECIARLVNCLWRQLRTEGSDISDGLGGDIRVRTIHAPDIGGVRVEAHQKGLFTLFIGANDELVEQRE